MEINIEKTNTMTIKMNKKQCSTEIGVKFLNKSKLQLHRQKHTEINATGKRT